MRKTFKYRLYPTKGQRTQLQHILDTSRWVYNKTLEVRRDAWQDEQKSLTQYDTNKLLTGWRREDPWLASGHAQVQQEAQKRVDLAFRAFFRRVKAAEPPARRNGDARKPGYPRFKGRHRYDSFTYPQPKGNFRLLDNGRLRLSKVGDVKIKLHRPVEGKVKTLTIRRDAVGNWYACFSCEVEPTPLPPTDRMTGVDAGLTHFATLSTGEHIPNPRFFRQDEKALAKAQRRLSACQEGTPEYRKLIRVVQHIHKRIANRRRDFAHKVSRRLVNAFQFIALEDLDIQEMQKGNHRGMNKSIADVAWGQLGRYTSFKAEEAGRTVVRVDPRGTTQECSGCGEIVHKDLSVRVHQCPHCGLVLDRDENAALNILARGLACVGSIPRSSLL
jgi:putative transposase